MVADYKNMERLFRENVPKSRLDLVLMEIDEITPDNILETVKKVEIDGNDTPVFYYSGHAANDAGSDVGSTISKLKTKSANRSNFSVARFSLRSKTRQRG